MPLNLMELLHSRCFALNSNNYRILTICPGRAGANSDSNPAFGVHTMRLAQAKLESCQTTLQAFLFVLLRQVNSYFDQAKEIVTVIILPDATWIGSPYSPTKLHPLQTGLDL